MSKPKLNFQQDRQTLLKARGVLIKYLDNTSGFPGAGRGLMKIIGPLDEILAALNRSLDGRAEK
ncbi:MAG: hypothetical protein M0Z32_04890 [Actinomycetota bacterium]|jgi:hypothetical protein|nr:hypothetical protein [Actinomycetota bacterium]MCL6094168.1 hypothetical protein [Actinomycetota bacterium]MDA8167075.1 hypothetical protein [Actinomycetota bacterium]